eukprot:scaffold447619_cov34-Prasinocladus_malaysianus.AAC.1
MAFLQIDRVLLLAAGRQAYYGPPGRVEPYFAAAGFPCPPGIPIADHMLQIVSSPDNRDTVLLHGENNLHSSSRRAFEYEYEHDTDRSAGDAKTGGGMVAAVHKSLVGTDVLLWRSAVNLLRSPALLLMHNLVGLAMGVAMGFVFYGVDDSLAGLQNKAGG